MHGMWMSLAYCLFWMADAPAPPSSPPVSYSKEIRPLFQKHCQGCHQPAKRGGDLLLTSYGQLMKGGEAARPSFLENPMRAFSSNRSVARIPN